MASSDLLLGDLVRAPLWQGRLLLPTSSRRDAVAGLALLAPNRRNALAATWAYGAWVRLAGPRCSGRALRCGAGLLDELGTSSMERILERIGPVTGIAMIDPRQSNRPRLAAIAVRDGVPVAFLKLNARAAELDRERQALDRLTSSGVNARVPSVLAHGTEGGVAWMATTAMSSGWTTPVTRLPVGWRTGEELSALSDMLGPPPSADLVPLHGDLTPWNLRHCAGETWLLDWEEVCWGPRGADEAYFHATATAVCNAPLRPAARELVEHWRRKVSERTASGTEERFRDELLAVLARMAVG